MFFRKKPRTVAQRLQVEIDGCRHAILTHTRELERSMAQVELCRTQLARAETMYADELERTRTAVATVTGVPPWRLFGFLPLPDGIVPGWDQNDTPSDDPTPKPARQA